MTTDFRVSILKKNYYYLDFLEKKKHLEFRSLPTIKFAAAQTGPLTNPSPPSRKKSQIMFRCKYLPQIKKGKACLKNSLRNIKFVCMTSTKYFSPWGYIYRKMTKLKKTITFS